MAMPFGYLEIKNFHPEHIPINFKKVIDQILDVEESDLGRVLLEQIKPGISIQV